jgi:hypothetical protein
MKGFRSMRASILGHVKEQVTALGDCYSKSNYRQWLESQKCNLEPSTNFKGTFKTLRCLKNINVRAVCKCPKVAASTPPNSSADSLLFLLAIMYNLNYLIHHGRIRELVPASLVNVSQVF